MRIIIKSIKKKNKNLSTKIFNYDDKSFIPENALEFAKSFVYSDDWNHWVYSKIFKFDGKISCKQVNKTKIKPKFLFNKDEINLDNYLMNSILGLPDSKKLYTQNLFFPKKFKILYNIFFKQLKYSSRVIQKNLSADPNITSRSLIDKFFIKKKDNFTKFALYLIKYCLPKIYLENFNIMNDSIKNFKVPYKPKIIASSADHFYNDAFKFYAAKKNN